LWPAGLGLPRSEAAGWLPWTGSGDQHCAKAFRLPGFNLGGPAAAGQKTHPEPTAATTINPPAPPSPSVPAQTISQPDPDPSAFDCILGNIFGFMLPFFLASAAGNAGLARTAIKELIDAYQASSPAELDLVGRVIGFSIAAMDNLRLSMTPDLSATQVLRCRCNAVSLNRSSDQALKILEAVQAKREQSRKIPRPSVAAAPPPPVRPGTPIRPSSPPLTAVSSNAGLINGGVAEVRRPYHDGGVFEERHARQHHHPDDHRSGRSRQLRCPCRHRHSQTSLAKVS
jgi:hypothetical protein